MADSPKEAEAAQALFCAMADYVGKNVPTARTEDVSVLLSEHDGRDGVSLSEGGRGR